MWPTVFRIKRRFAEEGLAGVLQDRSQAHRYRKLDLGRSPPHRLGLHSGAGGDDQRCAGWEGGGTGAASLRDAPVQPWQKQEWCIPQVSADFVAHMEDVLDLYAAYDPQRPVVCFETSTQLLADTRPPLPAQPGLPQRQDYGTGEREPATCSWPASLWRVGGAWR